MKLIGKTNTFAAEFEEFQTGGLIPLTITAILDSVMNKKVIIRKKIVQILLIKTIVVEYKLC